MGVNNRLILVTSAGGTHEACLVQLVCGEGAPARAVREPVPARPAHATDARAPRSRARGAHTAGAPMNLMILFRS